MALSSITRTALALRTKIEPQNRSTYFIRENGKQFDVIENSSAGEKIVFSTTDRAIARRRLDRLIDGE